MKQLVTFLLLLHLTGCFSQQLNVSTIPGVVSLSSLAKSSATVDQTAKWTGTTWASQSDQQPDGVCAKFDAARLTGQPLCIALIGDSQFDRYQRNVQPWLGFLRQMERRRTIHIGLIMLLKAPHLFEYIE